jgi:Ca2+-transporting ATPase
VLPKAKGDTAWTLLWRQINSPLIWVLIASGFVAMLVDPIDGIKNGLVILAVVVLNTLIGFVQEFKAGKAIEALSKMVPENVTALRDGKKATVAGAELVPGDVVLLASGDKVPADMRLAAVRTLKIEEAALTGESVPAEKNTDASAANAGIGDRSGMAFGGTLVTYGTATAVVCGTGAATELGRISTMLKEATDLQTPLTKALHSIGKYITIGIVVIAAIMLVVGTWRTMAETGVAFLTALRETVIFAIALAVGAIPEGLPAIVTIALAIGVQRMAARRAVIRKLPAVETLGSTTTICSDKTGTLTRNEMTVQALWTTRGSYSITGVGYEPAGQIKDSSGGDLTGKLPADVRDLLLTGALCNDATLVHEGGTHKITGDPTEAALVVSAEKIGVKVENARRDHARLDAIPFESENQFMATLNNHPDASPRIILKGAPEVILKRCESIDPAPVLAEVSRLAGQGMRVLAIAAKPTAQTGHLQMSDTSGGFTLLGLQGMIDPPRSEAIEAIKACHAAGISVKMITGDHAVTAAAIASQLGLADDGAAAVTGAQIEACDDARLRELAVRATVFARASPEHKLRLVRALQAEEHVVAMTGDGVNDAPALKQADVGVAMGRKGTEAAKQAGAIVLADDNFASIAHAVEEGRTVYTNLRKVVTFLLPVNGGESLSLLVAVLAGVALPILPGQILWVNMVSSVALAMVLAFEPTEADTMRRPPRRPNEPILSRFVAWRIGLVSLLFMTGIFGMFELALARGASVEEARTVAVNTLVAMEIFYLFSVRYLKARSFTWQGVKGTPLVLASMAAMVVLQAAFTYAPPMQTLFHTRALEVNTVIEIVAVGFSVLVVLEAEKWLRRRLQRQAD